MPNEYASTLARVATQLPAVRGEPTSLPDHDVHRSVLERLEIFATTLRALPVTEQLELVREPAPLTGNFWLDHTVAMYARKVAHAVEALAPAWSALPTLNYYLHAVPPYNPCDACLGAGAVVADAKSSRLTNYLECKGLGLVVTPGLVRVLETRRVLRDGPPVCVDRALLARIRTDEDMAVPPGLLVRRNGGRNRAARGDDEARRVQLQRFLEYRRVLNERLVLAAAALGATGDAAHAEYQEHDFVYKGALKRLVNPFAYLSGQSNWPRDPGHPPPDWKTAYARYLQADAAVERHQRWVQAVRKRDDKLQRRLERR